MIKVNKRVKIIEKHEMFTSLLAQTKSNPSPILVLVTVALNSYA